MCPKLEMAEEYFRKSSASIFPAIYFKKIPIHFDG